MTDYSTVKKQPVKPDNNQEAPKEHIKKQAIVKKAVKKQKRGVIERLVIGMLGPDGLRKIGRNLNADIIMPAIKETIVNVIKSGVDMAVYGSDSAPRQQRYTQPTNYGASYRSNDNRYHATTYNDYSRKAPSQAPSYSQLSSRAGDFRSEEWVIQDRNEALAVLDDMRQSAYDYGQVSLADFYDLLGEPSTYTDNNYGWTDLEKATMIVVRGGYALRLPELQVL